jgi:uncharacterized protein (DUF2267 family)
MTDFNKYAQEGNAFINELAQELGHENDKGSVTIALRSVLHTFRDRIQMSESLHFLAQLPFFLKALYVDQWKYRDRPLNLKTVEEFKDEVKMRQLEYGERDFDWQTPTENIIKGVMHCLRKYISEGEMENLQRNLPQELRSLVEH